MSPSHCADDMPLFSISIESSPPPTVLDRTHAVMRTSSVDLNKFFPTHAIPCNRRLLVHSRGGGGVVHRCVLLSIATKSQLILWKLVDSSNKFENWQIRSCLYKRHFVCWSHVMPHCRLRRPSVVSHPSVGPPVGRSSAGRSSGPSVDQASYPAF